MSLLPYYYDFERPFRLMERDFYRPDDFISPSFNHLMPRDVFSPDFFKPWDNVFRPWESFIKPLEQLSTAMNHLAIKDVSSDITCDKDKFQVNIDVQHFRPEEVNVKVMDGEVLVEGKHEEKRDQHGYISRQFQRRYTLPQGCLPDTVVSKLSSDGVLTVTAPRVLALPSTGERIVPITHTGPVQKQVGFQPASFSEIK